MELQSLFPQKNNSENQQGTRKWHRKNESAWTRAGFLNLTQNFIDPGAKRNYGNELGALKRSSAVIIVSPSNPSYLRIKLTYIYTNTHTFIYKLPHNFSLSRSHTHSNTHTYTQGGGRGAKSLVVG